jgi:hypothetical protein
MTLQEFSFGEDNVKHMRIIYRIRSEDLDPGSITRELNIEPTYAYTKGEKYIGKAFDPQAKRRIEVIRERSRGAWDIVLEEKAPTRKRVEGNILDLLELLEPRIEKIQALLKDVPKYAISFYVNIEVNGGVGTFTLSSDILERMARLSHFTEYGFLSIEDDDAKG